MTIQHCTSLNILAIQWPCTHQLSKSWPIFFMGHEAACCKLYCSKTAFFNLRSQPVQKRRVRKCHRLKAVWEYYWALCYFGNMNHIGGQSSGHASFQLHLSEWKLLAEFSLHVLYFVWNVYRSTAVLKWPPSLMQNNSADLFQGFHTRCMSQKQIGRKNACYC